MKLLFFILFFRAFRTNLYMAQFKILLFDVYASINNFSTVSIKYTTFLSTVVSKARAYDLAAGQQRKLLCSELVQLDFLLLRWKRKRMVVKLRMSFRVTLEVSYNLLHIFD